MIVHLKFLSVIVLMIGWVATCAVSQVTAVLRLCYCRVFFPTDRCGVMRPAGNESASESGEGSLCYDDPLDGYDMDQLEFEADRDMSACDSDYDSC